MPRVKLTTREKAQTFKTKYPREFEILENSELFANYVLQKSIVTRPTTSKTIETLD